MSLDAFRDKRFSNKTGLELSDTDCLSVILSKIWLELAPPTQRFFASPVTPWFDKDEATAPRQICPQRKKTR